MIKPVRWDGLTLRAAALLGVGVLGVHELRYLAGYGTASREMLSAHGHSYLSFVTSLVVLVVVLAVGGFIAHVARGGQRSSLVRRTRRVAPAAAAALFGIYSLQEFLEGLLASGHPAGFSGVYGNGGWTAVFFAAAIGLVVALLLRGAEAVLERVATRRRRKVSWPSVSTDAQPAVKPRAVSQSAISRNLAGRAPPLPLG